jgi:dTDP-4-dehydrorhamnose 3,5-epimerase
MDVVVDIRKDSPTFLQWHAELLNAENQTSLFIPEGFAHGFQTLTDDSELIYIHSEFYSSQSEGIINALDPTLGISWPLPVTRSSERDQNAPMLGPGFAGISLQ